MEGREGDGRDGKEMEGTGEGGSRKGRECRETGGRTRLGYLSGGPRVPFTPLRKNHRNKTLSRNMVKNGKRI